MRRRITLWAILAATAAGTTLAGHALASPEVGGPAESGGGGGNPLRNASPTTPAEIDVLSELETVERRLVVVEGQLRDAKKKEDALTETRRADDARLAAATQAHAQHVARAGVRLRSYYQLKRRGVVRLVFDAADPTDMRRRARYLHALVQSDEDAARALAQARDAAASAARQVEADQVAATKLREELEVRRKELERKREVRLKLIRTVRQDLALLDRYRANRDASAETIREVATRTSPPAPGAGTPNGPAPASSPAPVASSGAIPAGDSFRAARGTLRAPVRGTVARTFGSAGNLGLDFDAPLGTAFVAVHDGVVAHAGYVRGYGQVVTVQHGPYATVYAHANGLRVAEGQAVRAGEVLGNVGNTGLVEDADGRLHFELRYNGTPQDPAEWLAR